MNKRARWDRQVELSSFENERFGDIQCRHVNEGSFNTIRIDRCNVSIYEAPLEGESKAGRGLAEVGCGTGI